MRNPALHWSHWNSINTVPELYFVVIEILIMNNCTFEGDWVRKNESFFCEKHVSGLNNAVQHTIKMHAIAHGLSNNNIDFSIELIPWQYFNKVFLFILFDYLFYHINVLLLSFTLSIDYTIYFLAPCFNSEKRKKTVHSLG